MHQWFRCLSAAILAGALAACGGSPSSENRTAAPAAAYETVPAAAGRDRSGGEAARETGETARIHNSAVLGQKAEGRQLVVSAAFDFQTENVRRTTELVEQLTSEHGGFVQNSSIRTGVHYVHDYPQRDGSLLRISRYVHHGEMVVRVPSGRAAAFVRGLQAQIRFLNGQHLSAEDVSLDIRRRQLEAVREQELSRRLDEVASSSEPSVKRGTGEVVRQQFDARAAAEYAALQQAYWADQVAFATIRLNFAQPETLLRETVADHEALERGLRPGFWRSAAHMAEQGWYGLLDALLLAVAAWPLWLAAAVCICLWYGRRRRKRRQNRS